MQMWRINLVKVHSFTTFCFHSESRNIQTLYSLILGVSYTVNNWYPKYERQRLPMWNSPAWKRLFPCNSTGFFGSSILIGYFRNFSDKFWPIPVGKHRKFIRICRKKSHHFSTGILLPIPVISSVFLRDPRIFPVSFLKDPVGSGDRNDRPG